jgi:hypothetical protein
MDNQFELLFQSLEDITYETTQQLDILTVGQLEEFLDIREGMFEQLQKIDISDELKTKIRDRVHSLLEADKRILIRLSVLKEEAVQEIRKFEVARRQKSAYIHYEAVDSYFIDKKK